MKAISLYQPWASLVAIGAKRIETRSWATNHRGSLAIHAAQLFPKWARDLCGDDPYTFDLVKGGYKSPETLPRGAVVATCSIISCLLIQADGLYFVADRGRIRVKVYELPAEPELSFGDFTPGRWAWMLKGQKQLSVPVTAKGHQGLWNWEPPEGGLIA